MATARRSGGKMVRPRRTVGSRTPYDRPPRLLPNTGHQNPNWLSRLILSPSRMIAAGAGKVLASVFGPDSSSSSSSNGDSSLDDVMDDISDDNDISSQSADMIDKKRTTIMTNSLTKDPQTVALKSETKHAIEQHLMQETFSREECNRLTDIIKSRVVDSPVTGGSEVVTEARKWMEEKKLGSNSKSELEYGTCTLNTAVLPHVIEGEPGSPVDLAKSYMRARPPWASPTLENVQFNSPSPTGMQPSKEATPYRLGGNSLSSTKLNKDSPTTGSWNILEEIRKVRAKATEEMLRTRPSSAIDWSALASGFKGASSFLNSNKMDSGMEDKISNSTQLVNVPLKWSSTFGTNGFRDLQMTQKGLQIEAFPLATTSTSKQSQDLAHAPFIEGRGGLWDGSEGTLGHGQQLQPSEGTKAVSQSCHSNAGADDGPKVIDEASQPLSSVVGGVIQGSRKLEINGSTLEGTLERGKVVAANGFPTPGSSLSGGQEKEQKSMLFGEEHNPDVSDNKKMTRTDPVNEACEFLSEASVEVPIINGDESIVTGSQNSSSALLEGLSQDLSQPNSKHGLAGNTSVTEKEQGRKVGRPSRKGRGRGK